MICLQIVLYVNSAVLLTLINVRIGEDVACVQIDVSMTMLERSTKSSGLQNQIWRPLITGGGMEAAL